MKNFVDIEDVEEWFGALDYEAFWDEAMLFNLPLQPRKDCDRQIAAGEVSQTTVLSVLKTFARIEIARRQELSRRMDVSWETLH